MKKIAIFLLPALFLFACGNTDSKDNETSKKANFSLSGTLTGAKASNLVLSKIINNKLITVDTVKLGTDGKFEFNNYMENAEFCLLTNGKENSARLIIAPNDKIILNAEADKLSETYSVEDSKDNSLLINLNKELYKTLDGINELTQEYNKRLSAGEDTLKTQEEMQGVFVKLVDQQRAFTKKFIDDNITSLAAIIALYQPINKNTQVLSFDQDLAYFKKVEKSLAEIHPNSSAVKILQTNLSNYAEMEAQRLAADNAKPQIGDMAPDIKLPSPEGKEISLSSLKGKYVLLDFWAAWCGPCRKESPVLVKDYAKFKDKNFTIYQVSLDKTADAWKAAIIKDNLEDWYHVSDLQHWKCAPAKVYGVRSIPANFLLDPTGKIIATNLRGSALEAKLAEVLK